jgi:hypothetical protein
MTAEFWVSSGHLFLDHDADGFLRVTDDFLRAYLARPELLPPAEACAAERALHAALMVDPFGPIEPAGLADADARENWRYFRALRDVLASSPHVEAAYGRLVGMAVPPVMLDQLVHVILRNGLHGTGDAMLVRAAELFFREQRVATHAGRTLVADAETVGRGEAARAGSPLLAMLAGPAESEIEVLGEHNAASYWERSDAYAFAMDLEDLRPALAEVIRVWLGHMAGVAAAVVPVARVEDSDWRWFIGLDERASGIGNALWNGAGAAEGLLALYRLDLLGQARPVWLMLAGDGQGSVRIKPQNLLFGLPEMAA